MLSPFLFCFDGRSVIRPGGKTSNIGGHLVKQAELLVVFEMSICELKGGPLMMSNVRLGRGVQDSPQNWTLQSRARYIGR